MPHPPASQRATLLVETFADQLPYTSHRHRPVRPDQVTKGSIALFVGVQVPEESRQGILWSVTPNHSRDACLSGVSYGFILYCPE